MEKQEEWERKSETVCAEEELTLRELREEILRLRRELDDERAQKEFLISAIESLPNPIFIKDDQAKFVFFNQNYGEFFEMNREDFIGKSVLELSYLPMEDRERYQREDLRLIQNASVVHYEVDFPSPEGDVRPSFYWSRGFLTPETGLRGLVGEIVDISKERALENELKINIAQLEKANETIAAASITDPITGLYNRRILGQVMNLTLKAKETDFPICFLMADLDHFKAVNDNFGHLVGDDVLMGFAGILKDSCRKNDLVIRYGGEEFLILLNNVSISAAGSIAERIREKTERELRTPDGKSITVSLGVTQHQTGDDLNTCLARADAALYRAKESGRNRVEIDKG